jgi:hypothetical protein
MSYPSRALVLGLMMSAGTLLLGCFAHVGYDDDSYYDDEPPPGYVATVSPYYYEGRPAYWQGHRIIPHRGKRSGLV